MGSSDAIPMSAPIGSVGFLCGVSAESDKPFLGGCAKPVHIMEAFRCGDCTVYFHRDCLRAHFEQVPIAEATKDLENWRKLVEPLAKKGKGIELVGVVAYILECNGRVKKKKPKKKK